MLFGISPSEEALNTYEAKEYFNDRGETLLYRMLTPQDIKANRKYPLVLFLHGAGERGNDNERQLIWGADMFLSGKNRSKYPCFVIMPQCPEEKRWVEVSWGQGGHAMPEHPSETMALVIALMEKIITEYPVDPRRIYVTGLSMGGYGTWDLISRMPDYFAAAVPICGGGDEAQANKLVDIPLWAFHSADDRTVPVERSRNMVNAVREAGGKKIRYTEYEDAGHGSWKPAYADPKLMRWMFRQRTK
ncbi:MAG: prolyl oligopeptidase family serine peptidase [FCB group bacterium]|nr:prolyl oligopeptidase family serine peptidase [FCB group bacterium]